MIEEVLPRAMYSVRLDDGRLARVGLAAVGRHQAVRLIAGDVVLVRISPFDPHRGQILKKL